MYFCAFRKKVVKKYRKGIDKSNPLCYNIAAYEIAVKDQREKFCEVKENETEHPS